MPPPNTLCISAINLHSRRITRPQTSRKLPSAVTPIYARTKTIHPRAVIAGIYSKIRAYSTY